MARYDGYGNGRSRRGSIVLWIFIGILIFCAIYFPLFGGNLRYRVGTSADNVLTTIGTWVLFFGVFLIMWGILSLLCSGGLKSIKPLIIGYLLIVIGTWLINPLGGIAGTNRTSGPRGYH